MSELERRLVNEMGADAGASLLVRLCGDGMVLRDGARVALGRKALALLAYLTLEPGPHTRAQLSALLWPDADEAHASMSLRQALARLREIVGDRLQADRAAVSLAANGTGAAIDSDVHQFRRFAAADPLAATTIRVHRFFNDSAVDDAPDFQHWVDITRAQLTRQLMVAFDTSAATLAAQQDWQALAELAERWLTIDPLSESAVERGVEAACMRRDVSLARMLRQDFAEAMRSEGISATGALARLDALIRRADAVGAPTPARGVPALTVRDAVDSAVGPAVAPVVAPFLPPLLEREEAWQQLRRSYASVQSQRSSRCAVISGGLGSGRSRLMQDFTTWVGHNGATCLCARSPSTSAAPFTVIAALVRNAIDLPALAGVAEAQLRTLAELVPEVTERFPLLRRSGSSATDAPFAWRVQQALADVVLACADDATVLVAVDDAVTGDLESAIALRAVRERTAHSPVLWLFTGADERASESARQQWHELMVDAVSVEVRPLSEGAILGMLASHFGAGADWSPLAARLHAVSHGVAGIVCGAIESLRETHGYDIDRLQQATVRVPPLSITLQRRIDELDEVSETVLLALAMLVEEGHPVPAQQWADRPALTLDQLSHSFGISRLRAAMIGQRLTAARLAVESGDGYRCASPVVAEHCFGRGGALMKTELRRVVGGSALAAPR